MNQIDQTTRHDTKTATARKRIAMTGLLIVSGTLWSLETHASSCAEPTFDLIINNRSVAVSLCSVSSALRGCQPMGARKLRRLVRRIDQIVAYEDCPACVVGVWMSGYTFEWDTADEVETQVAAWCSADDAPRNSRMVSCALVGMEYFRKQRFCEARTSLSHALPALGRPGYEHLGAAYRSVYVYSENKCLGSVVDDLTLIRLAYDAHILPETRLCVDGDVQGAVDWVIEKIEDFGGAYPPH